MVRSQKPSSFSLVMEHPRVLKGKKKKKLFLFIANQLTLQYPHLAIHNSYDFFYSTKIFQTLFLNTTNKEKNVFFFFF